MTGETFDVWQFFADGAGQERVRLRVPADEAVKAFKHYTTSVGARIGTTERVIIVDNGDLTCAEWVYGKGVTFPPRGTHE